MDHSLQELTNLQKWLYTFKNLHEIEKLPQFLNDAQFQKILEIAALANMTKEQHQEYERSLKQLRDEYAIKTTAHKEGLEEGLIKGATRTIKKLLNLGSMSIAQIADIASVEEAYVEEIKKTMGLERK